MDRESVVDRSMNQGEQGRILTFLLPVVCALAAILRAITAYHGGIWADESFLVLIIRLPSWAAMLDFLRFHESHPPFFYVLMRLWAALFGPADEVLLVLPVIIGTALVPAVYRCAERLFNQRVAILSATLVAVSPSLIEYSAQLRPYGLLPLLTLGACYGLARAIADGGFSHWGGYIAFTTLLLYTHNWGWLIVLGQVVTVCSVALSEASFRRRWREVLAAWFAIGIFFLPWVPAFLYQTQHAGHSPVVIRSLSQFLGFATLAVPGSVLLSLFSSFSDRPFAMAVSVMLGLMIAVAIGLSRKGQFSNLESTRGALPGKLSKSWIAMRVFILVPSTALLAAIAISPRTNMVLPRCLVMLAPLVIVSASAFAERAIRNTESRLVLASTAGVLAWFTATCIACDESLIRSVRSNAREIAAAVNASLRPGDLLIVAPEWYAAPFNHYFHGRVEQVDFPHPGKAGPADFSHVFERVSDPRPLSRLRRQIDDARTAGRRILVISGRNYVRPISREDVVSATEYHQAALMSVLRVNQIRRYLEEKYGTPDSIAVTHQRSRYEELVPYVYSAAVSDSAMQVRPIR